jgi:hypothetical protein
MHFEMPVGTNCGSNQWCYKGECKERWQNSGYGTVIDTKTGLMWQNNTSLKNWNDSIQLCGNLVLEGYSDWRLPDIDELRTLIVGCTKTIPGGECQVKEGCGISCFSNECNGCELGNGEGASGCYLNVFFEKPCASYYSSSKEGSDNAWVVEFNKGSIYSYLKTVEYYARCVR